MPAETEDPIQAEWLEADGRGGFASGTIAGILSRRYHAILLTSTVPPAGRMVLVNGIEAWVEQGDARTPISSQHYAPDTIHPDRAPFRLGFSRVPWPCWRFRLAGGGMITQEIVVDPVGGDTVLRWRCDAADGTLRVRPLMSVRDYHALARENAGLDFTASVAGGNTTWRPYAGRPAIACLTNGAYRHDPCWYKQFLYSEECRRGLDCIEDLASPGVFSWATGEADMVMVLRQGDGVSVRAGPHAARVFATEGVRRAALTDPLARAAEAYLADRGQGSTIIAGYPWFTDWGRDTFIAMRGLLLGTGRIAEAEFVLLAWSGQVSEGMLPNRFGDGGAPEYNTADASLWFIVAAHALLLQGSQQPGALRSGTEAQLRAAAEAILEGHVRGTRYAIGRDEDGLLRAGVPGQQLTWMDAKVGDWVVTPRIGKPVEIQALWHSALRIAATWNPRWTKLAEQAAAAFAHRFASAGTGGLPDVVDADHIGGRVDASVRPNQIFAVGGLPFPLLQGTAARAVVDAVEALLVTPLGLRTLSPADPAYRPHYAGGPRERDGAYHQGTVWPWLMGPFVEAWLRVRGDTPAARATARDRFLAPLLAHLDDAGLGHVSEVADGAPPHRPGGCPFQAWSLGELIRIRTMTDGA
jgi:predicted glycogen debranching enzyme